MQKSSVRPTDTEIERVVTAYSDMLFRICFVMLGSECDAEDAVSDTFMRYMKKSPVFRDSEHEKAWLIRVASNICRDIGRFRARNNYIDLDDAARFCHTPEMLGIMEALSELAPQYRQVIVLHYIEGYQSAEMAKMLGISSAAVRKRLQYAREKLKLLL